MATVGVPPRFALGLSLAGGVSGGAYTAGVIDFLVEALDAWQEAAAAGHADAPPHEVSLDTMVGASSGALTAAVLGAALKYRFPPARAGVSEAQATANPLFDSWVNGTDIVNLLDTRDRGAGTLRSLLDPTQLEAVARKAMAFGSGVPPFTRRWLADPLRIGFTVTDLPGVSFSLAPPGTEAHALRATTHAEVMRFALGGLGGHGALPVGETEQALSFPADPRDKPDAWRDFATAALASAAFPVVLPAQPLRRRSAGGWAAFPAVDGGVLVNDPTGLARDSLREAGAAQAAGQAVLMVHPLVGDDDVQPGHGPHPIDMKGVLPAVLRALLDQVRVRPEDIRRALLEDDYGHFLIAPTATGSIGSESSRALAGASLGGFGGYLARRFREHDFRLGRRNAQHVFAHRLSLPPHHPLFAGWTDAQRSRFRIAANGELPIIPLVAALHPSHGDEEPLPDWPLRAADPEALAPAIDRRLQALYCRLLQPWFLRLLLYPLWMLFLRRGLRKAACASMTAALRKHRLL